MPYANGADTEPTEFFIDVFDVADASQLHSAIVEYLNWVGPDASTGSACTEAQDGSRGSGIWYKLRYSPDA